MIARAGGFGARLHGVARSRRADTARFLVPALLTAITVEIGVRFARLPVFARVLGIGISTGPHAVEAVHGSAPLHRSDVARYRAARHVLRIWPDSGETSCLRLALTAGFLLRHRRPLLRIGVARTDGSVVAHAWLIVDGVPLDPAARNYCPLTRVGS